MMHSYITYYYNGIKVSADVNLLNKEFWIFRINPENTIAFYLNYEGCKRMWLADEDQVVDPVLQNIIGAELMKIYGEEIQYADPHYTYSTTEYFICQSGEKDIIGFWDGMLRIEVTRFITVPFKPNINEIQFYGDDNGVPLAFETLGYNDEGRELILGAIKWYAEYINYPEMQVSSKYPGLPDGQ